MPCSDNGVARGSNAVPHTTLATKMRTGVILFPTRSPPTVALRMNEFVSSILDFSGARQEWRPISRWAVGAWLAFYGLFLVYAFHMHGGYLFIDSANLVVHEGGHLLFGWFGPTIGLWGGTILQWMVPLLLAIYFFTQRQTTAFAF